MTILRIAIGCILGLFLMSSTVLSETLEEKIQLYNNLQQAVDDPNIVWIPGTDDHTQRFVTKQQLGKFVRQELVNNGIYTHGRYEQTMQSYLTFSDLTIKGVKERVLPQLRAEINNMSPNANNYTASNGSSFSNTLQNLASDEHLNNYASQSQNQCPEWNPGNKSRNKFDSNNYMNDQTYVECNYFQDGKLSYQVPYVNGQKHGFVLKYNSSPPHHPSEITQYSNGKKNGRSEMWAVDSKSGHSWMMRKSEYTNGKLHGEQVTYHDNGVIRKSVMYNYGKPTINCSYDKSGKQLSCTSY